MIWTFNYIFAVWFHGEISDWSASGELFRQDLLTSQVERTKKHNRIDSENKYVNQNAAWSSEWLKSVVLRVILVLLYS